MTPEQPALGVAASDARPWVHASPVLPRDAIAPCCDRERPETCAVLRERGVFHAAQRIAALMCQAYVNWPGVPCTPDLVTDFGVIDEPDTNSMVHARDPSVHHRSNDTSDFYPADIAPPDRSQVIRYSVAGGSGAGYMNVQALYHATIAQQCNPRPNSQIHTSQPVLISSASGGIISPQRSSTGLLWKRPRCV
jgi:hypothetical protein